VVVVVVVVVVERIGDLKYYRQSPTYLSLYVYTKLIPPSLLLPLLLFHQVLLNKKYTLPHRVVDAVVDYFVRFGSQNHPQGLPVLWHQALLAFAQVRSFVVVGVEVVVLVIVVVVITSSQVK